MTKKQRRLEAKPQEIIYICTRCQHERSAFVTWETITKPPRPCPRCGGQDWKPKED